MAREFSVERLMIAAGSLEAVLAIIVAGIAAAGSIVAAWLSSRTRQESRQTKEQVTPTNGTTLAATVTKLEAQVAESRPLLEWARLKRAEELLGKPAGDLADLHRAEAILHGSIDEKGDT